MPWFLGAKLLLLTALLFLAWHDADAALATKKQKSLDEWRRLTVPGAEPPRVFTKGEGIHFYFETGTNVVEFTARWSLLRILTRGYRVNSALLHWVPSPSPMPAKDSSWTEAKVIAGEEWHRLTTSLIARLTPQANGHGIYYQGFLADRLWYRDAEGIPQFASIGEQPKDVIIDRHLSIEETMQVLAQEVEGDLQRKYPGQALFLLMAPNARRFPQPLLLNLKQRRCIWLSPAALYDTIERGLSWSTTAQGLEKLLFESHVIALIKNPVSSVARFGDLVVATMVRFVRIPFKPGYQPPKPIEMPGMDLVKWEAWLDHHTGTRREDGSLDLLIDGENFFPRLHQAIDAATNHLRFNVYIFDRDDVAVRVADQLKERAKEIEVKVILDQMGCIGAGTAPPETPLPEDFVAPASIASYLRKNSKIQVRSFLNPWFSADHSKVFLVDGKYAWLGGMNLGREYRYEWHDLMVELSGPVVATLEDEFRRNWAHAGPLGDLAYLGTVLAEAKNAKPSPSAAAWIPVRLLPTKTAWKPFCAAVQESIARAQSYIYVENPYLFDKRVIIGLVHARNRGVDVKVILPHVNDFKAGERGNIMVANYLLEHGVRVYFYPGMTHVKALLVDDWACVGSANLNHLSLRLCQEQNVATSDPGFVGRLKRELFEEDFSRAYEMEEPISIEWMDFMADVLLEGI